MTKPTIEGLGHATDCLEGLAWQWHQNNPNGYPQLADLADLLAWLDAELAHHRQDSAWGNGTDAQTIGRHGLNRPTENRLDFGAEQGRNQRGGPAQPPVEPSDPVYRELRRLQRDICATLTSLTAQYQHRANQAAGWPHRSEVG